jgi:xanthine dehydrogenase molybdenum-binding subunit
MLEVRFTLNGEPVRVDVREDERLLETLRGRLGITSLKDGCHPQGQCGACLAIVNGHARVTCTEPATAVDGGEVITLEGLSAEERAQIVRAFEAAAAGQCGFCLPGIALHAHTFLAKHPEPSRAEIAKGLDMHLCRCGGYDRIVDAMVGLAHLRRRGEASDEAQPAARPVERGTLREDGQPAARDVEAASRQGGVGAPIVRLDAAELILGTRAFASDLRREGMLHGALVLSAHARARVVRIDVSAARALPGVVVVATAKDVPGERWQGLLESDWPMFVAEGEEVRCAGDVLAAIAAESEAIAREAAGLVEVEYEKCVPVLSAAEALREGAPRVNPKHDNLLGRSVIARGDAASALAASAHVARGTFETQRIEHLFLETECAVAEPRGRGVAVWSQGQGIFDDRRQIASALGLPEGEVLVTLVPSGGAFGGKEDLSVQGHAALLAVLAQRPVRVALRRDESVRMHPKRHPMTIDMEVGCDAEGRLTAVRARIVGDSGAYASVGAKVLERAAGHACGPYRVPNVDVESRAVTTNNPPCGAMRGFGVPQVTFALEGCIDELAERVGLDRWEMRYRNAVEPGDALTTGQRPRASVGIQETLRAVKPAYDAARAAGLAVGIACGIKNSGLGNGAEEHGRARLVVQEGGTIMLMSGYSEMGQGLWTALAQIAAEASGLPVSCFRPELDTAAPLGCGQTTGSRAVLHGGRAVIAAARRLRAAIEAGATLESLAGQAFDGEVRVADTTPLGAQVDEPKTHTSYGFATQVCVLDRGGRVAKVIAAHDVGRAINPSLCAAQVEGAVVMGLGYALTEELPCEGGIPEAWSVRDLGALRARDVPEIEVILVETAPEPEGPYGAKGVGEIGLVPTAAAVASALAAFDGVRRRRLPMRDSPAAKAMHVGHPHAHGAARGHGEGRGQQGAGA